MILKRTTLAGSLTAPHRSREVRTTPRRTSTSTEVKRRYNDKVYAKIQAELPKDTVSAFKAKCAEIGVSQASVLLEAIENFLGD